MRPNRVKRAIAPGMIRTPFTANVYADEELARRRNEVVPMGRVGTPEDIAKAVRFLASDEASFITGEILTVAGGYRL